MVSLRHNNRPAASAVSPQVVGGVVIHRAFRSKPASTLDPGQGFSKPALDCGPELCRYHHGSQYGVRDLSCEVGSRGIRFGTALAGRFPGRLRSGIAGDLIGCVGQIHPGMEGGPRGSYHRNRKQQRRHAAVRRGQRALPDDSSARRRGGARGHILTFRLVT